MLGVADHVATIKEEQLFHPCLAIAIGDNISRPVSGADHRVRSLHQSAAIESSAQPSTSRTPAEAKARNVIRQDQAKR